MKLHLNLRQNFNATFNKSPKPQEKPEKEIIIRTVMQTYDDKSQNENVHGLKRELEQWRTRYNFVVSENAILSRQNKELEIEVSLIKF